MNNFEFFNPVRILFGSGNISKLPDLIPKNARVLLIYGGGSIKKNGIYDQIYSCIGNNIITEFSGISSNPIHEHCAFALEIILRNKIDFLLAVGGGSVIDATKYIAAASKLKNGINPWDILERKAAILEALPIGVVLTLPASGSEMNSIAVISSTEKKQKRSFSNSNIFPKFSILDPDVIKSLPRKEIINGIVDSFSHVIEQYLTYPTNALIQEKFSESILSTIVEIGKKILENPYDYDLRANMMWAASCALNGFISCGVPSDWCSHMIGHELTAVTGIKHAESIAVVLPGVINMMRDSKIKMIIQYGKKVFNLNYANEEQQINESIRLTEGFFEGLGQKTHLSDYGIGEDVIYTVSERIGKYPTKLGEKKNIGKKEVEDILLSRK